MDLLEDKIWPVASFKSYVQENSLVYLDIGHHLKIDEDPQKRDMEFWRKLYKQFGKPPFDTY